MKKRREAIVVVILVAICAAGIWLNPATSCDGAEQTTEQPAVQMGEVESVLWVHFEKWQTK